jgi:hypothetical protein
MRTAKRFDSVAAKDRIQARLAREFRGCTDDEVRRRIGRLLARSENPIGRLWRSLEKKR